MDCIRLVIVEEIADDHVLVGTVRDERSAHQHPVRSVRDHLLRPQVGIVPGREGRPLEACPNVGTHGKEQPDVVTGPKKVLSSARR